MATTPFPVITITTRSCLRKGILDIFILILILQNINYINSAFKLILNLWRHVTGQVIRWWSTGTCAEYRLQLEKTKKYIKILFSTQLSNFRLKIFYKSSVLCTVSCCCLKFCIVRKTCRSTSGVNFKYSFFIYFCS